MRKFLIPLVVAGSALAVAAPAAAQWAPPTPYGNAYGYNNFGQVRALQVRVDQIQRQIQVLGARRMLSRNEVRDLRAQSRNVEQRLRRSARYGLNPNEMRDVQMRIARLEQHVFREANDGRRWGNGQYGNAYAYDRDRDGRDDRYEDDRGTRHD